MNKTDKRQLLDEIEMLGKSEEHSGTFARALIGAITFTHAENTLSDKRKVYNYAYANIYRKYAVTHDDLYGDLDKVWNVSVNEKDKGKQAQFVTELAAASAAASVAGAGAGVAGLSAGAAAAVAASVGALAAAIAGGVGVLALFLILRMQYKVRKLWKSYEQNTYIYAQRYIADL